jgi:hypothetical protein
MTHGTTAISRYPGGPAWPAALVAVALALPARAGTPLPGHLRDTGLYAPGTLQVRAENVPFAPQYPLWSDGAVKRRWIHLPPGTSVDAARAETWQFPAGTKFWKEFGYARPVETRYLERLADGSWRFAAYVWNEDGTDAVLAPERGLPAHRTGAAPGGRYDIPAQDDCHACHEGARVPVLGFSALQLSTQLRDLAAAGVVRNLPGALLAQPPRIPADGALARAALGYLHGNCGHCHNGNDAAPPVDLRLEQTGAAADVAAAWRSLVEQGTQYGRGVAPVVPGDAAASVLVARMHSRAPADQMPPLGTRIPDPEGIALVERWIDSLKPSQEQSR